VFNFRLNFGWSTCVLACFSWLLNHVIYLKLIKKYCCFKLSKFTKWQRFSIKWLFFHTEPFWLKSIVVWWICSACNNSKKISLINHVIQESTKVNQNTCRPPCCLSLYCKQLYWGARNSFLKQLLEDFVKTLNFHCVWL
jgi:hypothetical protein